MSAEVKKEIQLEIAHVLFIDIVGYSKLSINEQHAVIEELKQVVRASEQFQRAEAAGRLIKIATGDGMALVFYTSPEAPAQCAVEISRALKEHPRLQRSHGHSQRSGQRCDRCEWSPQSRRCRPQHGPTGDGLRRRRTHSCLQTRRRRFRRIRTVATAPARSWRCEVKHGMRVAIANLYADEVGNPQLPKKFQALKKHRRRVRWAEAAIALLVLAAIVAAFIFVLRRSTRSAPNAPEKSIAVLPFGNLSAIPTTPTLPTASRTRF